MDSQTQPNNSEIKNGYSVVPNSLVGGRRVLVGELPLQGVGQLGWVIVRVLAKVVKAVHAS